MKTLVEAIPCTLEETRSAVAEVLHWPDNLGVEFRRIQLHGERKTEVLAIFVRGVADEELVLRYVIEPLSRAGVTGE